ncbi:MAG: response regulator [Chthoniobacteraceae bacterium]|nr:response regulator [Chthoniobacteraceae bacterium]
MKLLIVDDSMIIRRAIERTFTSSVFDQIRTAADGMRALEEFKEFLPDVVTLDITMPHLDGIATLEEMLKLNPSTKVMIVSALADDATAIEALTKGADQFICKPFTNEELHAAVQEML